jgi:hypothetical protein
MRFLQSTTTTTTNNKSISFYHIRLTILLSLLLLFFTIIWSSQYRYGFFTNFFFVDDSQYKLQLAKNYLQLNHHHANKIKTTNNPSICVAINSIPRSPITYVERCLASVLQALDATTNTILNIQIAVMDMNPLFALDKSSSLLCSNLPTHAFHECLTRSQLISRLPSPLLQNSIQKTDEYLLFHPQINETVQSWVLKQKIDYALSLNWCNCTYCIILEDDAILSLDGFDLIQQAIPTLPPNWQLLRLYRSDFWEGFEIDHVRYFMLAGYIGLLFPGFFILCCMRILPRQLLNRTGNVTTKPSHIFIWSIFCAIWFPLFPYLLGKQHLPIIGTRTSGGIVPSFHFYAGAVGLMLPQSFAQRLASDIINNPYKFPQEIDLYFDEALEHNVHVTYELLPNPITHVGFISSAGKNKLWKFTSWFENHRVSSGSFHKTKGSPFA